MSGTASAAQRRHRVATLGFSPSSLSFGNISVGTSSTKSFTITNSGRATATITGDWVSSANFHLSGITLPYSLAPGSSVTCTVSFSPDAASAFSATIAVVSNATDSSVNYALSGSGISTASSLGATPGSESFGSVAVGSTSTQTIQLANSGSASITISGASTTGNGFKSSGLTTPLVIAAGQTSSFSVSFTPTSAGSVSGGVTLSSNASNGTLSISLSGTGTAPAISATPSSSAFGSVPVGTTNSQTIQLKNTGNANLTISGVSTSGAGFQTTGMTTPLVLTAGQSSNFTVNFAPTAAGAVTGSVGITSNASNGNMSVALSGTGTSTTRSLSANPSSISFGNETTGSTYTKAVSLTNTGNTSLTISSVSASGSGVGTSGSLANTTVSPGQAAQLNVTFAPASAGSVTGSVQIVSDAANSPMAISVAGTGVAPTVQHSVALSWNASTSSNVSGYYVYRSVGNTSSYARVVSSPVSVLDYTDDTVQNGLTYYYVVTSVDSSGSESAYSASVLATIPTT